MKLSVVGLAAMVSAGLLSLMATWWSSPVDRVNMNLYASFDQRDIVPVGYAAFAVTLGIVVGVLIRRTLPAMATTLVAFVAARVAFTYLLRPRLIAPVLRSLALTPTSTGFGSMNGGPFTLQPNPPNIPNAWVTSTQIVDKAGNVLSPQFVAAACPKLVAEASAGPPVGGPGRSVSIQAPAGVQQALQNCVTKVGATYHELVTYHPSSHYWPLQWYETAIYLGTALLLAGVSLWWVRRRLF
jgi:hypothetical protein